MNQPESADPRVDPRTNMFIGAVIREAGLSLPVKIRNMSVTGALVEGAVLPKEGAEVQLVRGSLAVHATVAWCARGRCGLRFSALASVRDWLAPPANAGQQRVDEAVRVLKLGAVPMPQRSVLRPEAANGSHSVEFGQDLRRVMRLVEDLGQALSSDRDMLDRRDEKLQNLDIALQTIAAVADGLAGETPEGVVAARLENLRASCIAALSKLDPAS
jgi:hypothetical protein